MDQTLLDKLYETFKVDIKPGGQGFKYVRTRYVLDRLNKVFGCNWATYILSHEIINNEVLVIVRVVLYDDKGNFLSQQEGFGSAKKFNNVELGNIFKSATSRAIKSAVRNWGVALFIEEDSNAGVVNSNNTNIPPSQDYINTPPSSNMPNMPSEQPTPFESTPPVKPESVPMPSNNVNNQGVNNEPPVINNNLPSTPDINSGAVTPPSNNNFPSMGVTPGSDIPIDSSEVQTITPVQKVAINAKLASKGMTFEQVAKDFYTSKGKTAPEKLDDMLYQDAIDLVTFLTSK